MTDNGPDYVIVSRTDTKAGDVKVVVSLRNLKRVTVTIPRAIINAGGEDQVIERTIATRPRGVNVP